MTNIQRFNVLNMNCNHCVNTIKKALANIKEIDEVTFDLENKVVEVSGDISSRVIIDTITEAGYEIKKKLL